MENDYRNALKKGQKYTRQRIVRGLYPRLPVLDEILPGNRKMLAKDLGLVQIPLEWVVGTVTSARAVSFAGNFMPAAEEGSEFADKWKQLCESHLEEGIREPVLAYEYMNRFYILEGNKRVSVLKYFDAVTVPGNVRRILPEPDQDQDEAAARYYELIEFYRQSGINFIEFSHSGSCGRLQNAVGKKAGEHWTEDEIRRFSSAYYSFRKIYLACGGDKLLSTTGDALLTFIQIYGYDALWQKSESLLKKDLIKAWGEIALQQESSMIEIRTEPEPEPSGKGLLQRVIGVSEKKAAFLYDEEPVSASWSYYHELGRNHVRNVFSGKISTKAFVLREDGEIGKILDELVGEGVDVIFVTFPYMFPEIIRTAIEHPEIDILSCSLNEPHRNIRAYYPRMYEAKFVAGAIAGALCRNHKLGYLSKYPIYGAIADINAFARGARMTDPEAEVYLEWSSVGGLDAAKARLVEKGAELVSFREFVKQKDVSRYLNGLKWMDENRPSPLVMPLWNWVIYYERILRAVLNGTFRAEDSGKPRSLNYFWGMSSGVVEMIYSEQLPESVRYLGEVLCRAIRDGSCRPFYHMARPGTSRKAPGKSRQSDRPAEIIRMEEMVRTEEMIRTQKANSAEETIRMEEIIRMDYLEENVRGLIPAYEELEEKAKKLVNSQGVEPSRKDAGR